MPLEPCSLSGLAVVTVGKSVVLCHVMQCELIVVDHCTHSEELRDVCGGAAPVAGVPGRLRVGQQLVEARQHGAVAARLQARQLYRQDHLYQK